MKIPASSEYVTRVAAPVRPRLDQPSAIQLEEPAAFANFLETTLQRGLNPSSEAGLLERTKLQRLVELVQIQMHKALLSSIAETEADEDEAIIPGWLNAAPTGETVTERASNITSPPLRSAPKPAPEGLNQIIEQAARTYGVNPALITSVIRAESGFDAKATSPKGAMGLMQLMPETARDLGVTDPYDPRENVMAGTRYLRSLLERYNGDVTQALAAYNWGMGNVERYPNRMPQETREYISRITQYLRDTTV